MDDIVNLLKKLKNNTSNSIRVCMPAKIEIYDFKIQKASVKIDMKELYEDGSNIDYPVVSGVPVVFMASGGASITLPVKKGDTCLLLFTDRDMSNWLLGGTGQNPNSTRMHNLSDAIALMGLFPFTKASQAENNTDVLITYSGSKIILKPDGVLNIETTKDVNIITAETINSNSKNVNITAAENVTIIAAKDVQIAATDDIFAQSKNTTLISSEDTIVKCRTINVLASENVDINAEGNIKMACTNAEINATEEVSIQCTTLRAVVAEDVVIECNEATLFANNNISINSKNNTITTTEDITVNCANATIKANNEISTTSIKFIHTGDMSISGNLELGGSGSGVAGAPISFSAGIKNNGDITNMGNIVNTGGTIRSGTVILDTHTHSYLQPVVGSSPTAATPASTGTPT
jgi:uncharacterized protein (DUF2345 family)